MVNMQQAVANMHQNQQVAHLQ
jgi:hypothetical protein